MDYKVYIDSIPASDKQALTQMQVRINQWITTGILKKYEIHTTGEYVVFNILKNKEAE
jgi:hypothetical protein